MSYFSKQFTEDLLLPDGSVASSVADVDKYLARSGLAMAGDYSPEYLKNIRYQQELERKKAIKTEFLRAYKRIIWNE
jgi:hypothetical protein